MVGSFLGVLSGNYIFGEPLRLVDKNFCVCECVCLCECLVLIESDHATGL